MDVLTESLRQASNPPPSRIDLDGLIAGERRRHRVKMTGGSALAVLLLAGAGVFLVSSGSGSGQPVGVGDRPDPCAPIPEIRTPPPVGERTPGDGVATVRAAPTEPTAAAVARLGVAFDQALKAAAPGMTFADARRPGCGVVQFANFSTSYLYEGMALATDAGGTGAIAVHLYQRPVGRPRCDAVTCEYEWIRDLSDGGVAFGSQGGYQVHVWRPDGTAMMLLDVTDNPAYGVSRITLPLTRDQLIAIGEFPALTLYPF